MLDGVIEWLAFQLQRARIRRQFRASLGYDGDFENPRTYQEKIQFRKLYGNHRFYALAADKYRVRDYVASKVGPEHLVPLLGAYDRLQPSVFDALPQQFVIKANHGCKWNQIVYDKSALDIDRVVRRFNTMCRRRYGWTAGERHYNFIKPKIVIEELLRGPDGGLPWDYNFFCYHGPGGFDYSFSICSPDSKGAAFTRDWEILATNLSEQELAPHLRPASFDAMVRVARDVSADLDFVRVDLYTVGAKVYFGELTVTPHQGYGLIEHDVLRKMRDEMWHLAANDQRLYRGPQYYGIRSGAPRRAVELATR
jgi:hypothetical protein